MKRQIPQVEGLSYLKFQPGWRSDAHSHPNFHELLFIVGGQIEVTVPTATVAGTEGRVIVYASGMEHQERTIGDDPLRLYCLAWQGGSVPDSSGWPIVMGDRSGRIRALLEWMLEIFPARDEVQQATLDSLMQAVLYEYLNQLPIGSHDETVGKVKAFISEHLAQPLSIDRLAEVACASKYHFAHLFEQTTGVAPMRYVRVMRAQTTRTLLLTTTLPLRAIAELVGYSDEFHLSRAFRRETGLTPTEVRSGRRHGERI